MISTAVAGGVNEELLSDASCFTSQHSALPETCMGSACGHLHMAVVLKVSALLGCQRLSRGYSRYVAGSTCCARARETIRKYGNVQLDRAPGKYHEDYITNTIPIAHRLSTVSQTVGRC